jgi:methionyl-tRNA formyltransferase
MQKNPDAPRLKLVFAGTPEFGLPSLEALSTSRHTIEAVYTQPDRSKGRGQAMQYSAIKSWAMDHHIPVFQPEHFKSEAVIEQLRTLNPDVMIVIAYGLILPKAVLTIPKLGCINVHASLLPAWRGASPIQSAILHGDAETGVTLMQMDVGMDTGDVLTEVRLPLTEAETAGTLHDKLSQLAVEPLLKIVDELSLHRTHPTPQAHDLATYSKKILKEEAHIDWGKTAEQIEREIRAYQPWPVSYCFYGAHRVRIFKAEIEHLSCAASPGEVIAIDERGVLVATGASALRIQQFQFPGEKVIQVSEWLRGHSLFVKGQCFK